MPRPIQLGRAADHDRRQRREDARCASSRSTPTCATSPAARPRSRTSSTCCATHCTDVGRDPGEITTTRMGTLVLTPDADETARVRSFLSGMMGDDFDEQFIVGEARGRRARGRGARRHRASTASSSTCRCPTPTRSQRAGELLVAQVRVASGSVTDSRRAARLRARCQAADHQLRRSRIDPIGERRGVRSAARRCRDDGHADGAVPVGARRGRDVPGRGRRRPPHPELRVGDIPLGPDHPLAQPARRRRRLPAHAARRLGPRRPRRGAQGVPGPDRAGDLLGLRRVAPRQPHGHAAAPGRLLRRVPRAGDRVRAAAAHGRRERRAHDRLPVPAGCRARKASSSPTTSCTRTSGRARDRTHAVRPAARRHRDVPASRHRHRRAARVASRLGATRRGPRATSPPTRRFATSSTASGAT